ncbi:hypothetical protein, conserved [Eimeria acervulina]|uniref:Uncharacterized protein n=1 Tax=Eimeria acervulina TaxID=5801 RepID=U6GW81_EIMAC|nr:hypothetical protein, conserved [Eimeria acervulina]CDI84455.1 hypothetical protein, conserved [Eimeria acervulina]
MGEKSKKRRLLIIQARDALPSLKIAHEQVNAGAKENPESAGSIEATEQEAEQAKNLQQAQGMPPQQSFHQVNSRYGANGTRLSNPHHSNEIHTAIEAARLRLTPPRKTIVTTSLLDQEGFAGDPGTSEFINDEEKRTDNSELAGTPNTEGMASREDALATDEVEAAGEISAAEKEAARAQASLKEENRLLAAAEEAEQAQRALKICAQGSFLSCRQGQIRRPIEEPHARVISGIPRSCVGFRK